MALNLVFGTVGVGECFVEKPWKDLSTENERMEIMQTLKTVELRLEKCIEALISN